MSRNSLSTNLLSVVYVLFEPLLPSLSENTEYVGPSSASMLVVVPSLINASEPSFTPEPFDRSGVPVSDHFFLDTDEDMENKVEMVVLDESSEDVDEEFKV